ncbi:MAG: LysM peptidoglycan-binding domain-containing protein, partial [Acidimicrobiales bacterium]
MRAFARVSRGLAASLVLLALLGGVPWFLSAAVGWPLPRAVPAWNDVTATLAGDLPLDADTVWKVLACVVWVAWAQILVAAVVEAAAVARGGVANPIRGLAHMQGITGPLLSAAALLLPGSLANPAANTGPAVSTARTLVARIEAPAAPPPGPSLSDAPPTAPLPQTTIEHTVVRRDTLWDLAERYLAPGGSNEDIAAAVQRLYDLNAGMPQPDGATLTDASRIRRGWVLRIPDTSTTAPAAVDDNGSAAATVVVQPGDSLWELAEDNLGDGLRYPELFDLNAGRPQPDGDALAEPSLIRPGWNIQLPAPPDVPTTAPSAQPAPSDVAAPVVADTQPPASEHPMPETQLDAPTADAPTTATPVAPAPADASATDRPTPALDPAPETTDDDHDTHGSPVGALGAAGGLLAAGLAVALATLRRRRRVQRLPGTELPPLPVEAEPILNAIADADLDISAGIDRALRRLAGTLADRTSIPTPIVGTVNGANLE